jgi:hypothetical protein
MRLATIFLFLISSLALSAEPDIRTTVIDNKPFVCLDIPSSQTLLQMRMDYPKLQLEVDSLKKLSGIRLLEINKLTGINTNLNQQKEVLTIQSVALQKELSKANAWYKSPWLWSAIGVAIGVGLTVGVTYLVR